MAAISAIVFTTYVGSGSVSLRSLPSTCTHTVARRFALMPPRE